MSGNNVARKPASNQSPLSRNQKRLLEYRQRKGRPQNSKNYVTYQSLHGTRFNPGVNPPIVNYMPWSKVTLVHVIKTTSALKVSNIPDLLKSQLDPENRGFNQGTSGDKAFRVQFKIDTIRAWNLTGNLLALTVDDFHDVQGNSGGREQLCGIIDTGSQGHIPCAGYRLPIAHRNLVLRNDDLEKDIYLLTLQLDSGASGLLYLDISFKFDGPAKPPSLATYISRVANLTSAIHKTTSDQSTIISGLADQLKKAVITVGVEKIAVLVASALEEDAKEDEATFSNSGCSTPSLLRDA